MWLCGEVVTGFEHRVKSWAIERGHEIYYPVSSLLQRKRNNRKLVVATRATWPGYVFAHTDTDLMELSQAPAFIGFVQFGPHVAMMSDEQIEGIRQDEADGVYDDKTAIRPQLILGDVKTITEGPMAGLRGIVTTVKADKVKLSRGDIRVGAVWVNADAVA